MSWLPGPLLKQPRTIGVWKPGHQNVILAPSRSEEHTSELQSLRHLVCRLLLEKEKNTAEGQALREGLLRVRHQEDVYCEVGLVPVMSVELVAAHDVGVVRGLAFGADSVARWVS